MNNDKDICVKQAHRFMRLRRFQFRITSVKVIHLITAVVISVAPGASAIAAPSEQQQQQQLPLQRDPGRLNSRKSYNDESQQLEDLWVSTMKNSAELRALIRNEYPTPASENEAGLVDIVQDVNPVGQHERPGNSSSLTIPSLEPDYPKRGRSIPAYSLPQYAKREDHIYDNYGVSRAVFMFRVTAGTDLKSRLGREAQNLFVCYKQYCSSLEFLDTIRSFKTPLVESATKTCEENRKKLVVIAGEKAVEQLDQQLEICSSEPK